MYIAETTEKTMRKGSGWHQSKYIRAMLAAVEVAGHRIKGNGLKPCSEVRAVRKSDLLCS